MNKASKSKKSHDSPKEQKSPKTITSSTNSEVNIEPAAQKQENLDKVRMSSGINSETSLLSQNVNKPSEKPKTPDCEQLTLPTQNLLKVFLKYNRNFIKKRLDFKIFCYAQRH